MKKLFVHLWAVLLLVPLLAVETTTSAHAQSCLGPAQQRKAVASGQARPFGVIASKLRGELIHARLCKRGGGLVYFVTVLQGSRRVDAVYNARNGKRLR